MPKGKLSKGTEDSCSGNDSFVKSRINVSLSKQLLSECTSLSNYIVMFFVPTKIKPSMRCRLAELATHV